MIHSEAVNCNDQDGIPGGVFEFSQMGKGYFNQMAGS